MKDRSKDVIKGATLAMVVFLLSSVRLSAAEKVSSANEDAGTIKSSHIQAVKPGDSEEMIIRKAAHVIPTPRQLAYHKGEYSGFVHFGPNTFTRREWGTGMEDPKIFDLKNLDTDQWCRTMKAAQMTMVVLTCKHHDGFVLWQSRYTKHGVVSSPWLKGKGDIVKELSKSCKKYGLKLGVYLSPADLYQIENKDGLYGNLSKYTERVIPRPVPGRPFKDKRTFTYKVDDYNEYFLNQLFELLTEYGPISEVWFDGAHPKRKGGQKYNNAAWFELIRTLAPDAVIFGKGPDVRWCGNEHGNTRSAEWNVIPMNRKDPRKSNWRCNMKDLGSRSKVLEAKYFYYLPGEVDTSIRKGWFYRDDTHQKVRSADEVFDIYERTVGGNSVFLLNVPPNRQGVISELDKKALLESGRRIKQTYGEDLLVGAKGPKEVLDNDSQTATTTKEIIVSFDKTALNRFLVQEEIESVGQRIETHALDAWIGGQWKEVATGTTVGYKKFLRFPTIETTKLRLRIIESRLIPAISKVSAHYYRPNPLPVTVSRDKEGYITIDILSKASHGKSQSKGGAIAALRIHYTTDGTEPTLKSPRYDKPFKMKSGTVKACTFSGSNPGAIASKVICLSKSDWKLLSVSSQQNGYNAQKAFDGNPKTFWHTSWAKGHPTHPHSLAIDLGDTTIISGFTYLPRQDRRVPDSMIDKGRIEVSLDGKVWKVVEDFEFGNLLNDPAERTHRFKKHVKARYIKLVSTHGVEGKPYAGAAEIGVIAR